MFRIKCGLIRSWFLAAGLLLVPAWCLAQGVQQGSLAGRYFLSVDGAEYGLLKSADGFAAGSSITAVLFFPANAGDVVSQWIAGSWAGQVVTHDCVVTQLDQNGQAISAKQFKQAFITSTTIPACDAASQEPGYLAVAATGLGPVSSVAQASTPHAIATPARNRWTPSRFKLEIDGLDCTIVTKIDSFTVSNWDIIEYKDGEDGSTRLRPGNYHSSFPNLRITVPESNAQTWRTWCNDFLANPRLSHNLEKSGTLTFFAANGASKLLQINFEHLGVIQLETVQLSDGNGGIIADLYCKKMVWVPVDSGSVTSATKAAAGVVSSEPRPMLATENTAQAESNSPAGGVTPGSGSTLRTKNPAQVRSSAPVASLDASLTAPRTMGTDPQYEFALKGLGFTVTRQRVGTDSFAPDAQSKLLLIRYSIHNSSGGAMPVSWSMPALQVTDSNGANYPARDIGVGPDLVPIGGSISPDQTIDCCAVLAVSGRADATALTVATEAGPPQRYLIGGQAQIKETFARDASAGASAGFTALAEVPIKAGTFYPMYDFDYRLDGIAYGTRLEGKDEPPAGTQCLIATFTVRNPSPERKHLDSAGLAPRLTLSDGTITKWYGYPLSALRDERTNGDYNPGQEVQMRVFFDVPASKTVTPASFRFSEGQSRVYASDVP